MDFKYFLFSIRITFVSIFLGTSSLLLAGEGMWLPFLLSALNEAEMKSLGMKMSAEDIYSINKGSLKDAVVHFGGFCTAEVVSDQGLIFTNHHCGYDAIQSHSTLENNYLTNGFWASKRSEEKPNPGLFATFIVSIHDVSAQILEGTNDNMTMKERQSIVDGNISKVSQQFTRAKHQDVMIKPFFEGNHYYLFVTETYRDVRLVGAPPESIGKFGADTDNWVWPRHTGDFSVFRIYAGPDNLPAEYSPDNKPLKPRHYFPISLDGVDEGDFTLVFGFPGRTYQYLPSYAVEQIKKRIDPARIGVRNISLGIMDKHMRQSEDARLALASKYAGLSNSWKKWIGEVQGLTATDAVKKIMAEEKEFLAAMQKNKTACAKYGDVLATLKELYQQIDPYAYNRTILAEVIGGSNIELFTLTFYAHRMLTAYQESGQQGFQQASARYIPAIEEYGKDFRPDIDREVFVALFKHLNGSLDKEYLTPLAMEDADRLASEIYNSSFLVSAPRFVEAINMGGEKFMQMLQADKAYQLYVELKKVMDERLSPQYNMLNEKIQMNLKDYLTAMMEVYPDRRFWPDANNTMRVTYGQVESYEPRDAVRYETQTYLDGIMEKYKPGDYEFDVHPKLIQLYETKNYGPYAEDGKLPVCFIASNHTTGGNSGSPAIDGHGNLIGINFDRVWEGTMSDLYYDRSICRNIMVDMRYVLFVIDKFAGAGHLIDEMKLVHPKLKK